MTSQQINTLYNNYRGINRGAFKVIYFVNNLKREIPEVDNGLFTYDSTLLLQEPVGFTHNSRLSGKCNCHGFLNTGVSIHLGGINIPKLIVEYDRDSDEFNLSVKYQSLDKVKSAVLKKLEPALKFGRIRDGLLDFSLYDLIINQATIKKVKNVHEDEIKVIGKKLNLVDRLRKEASANMNNTLLETLECLN